MLVTVRSSCSRCPCISLMFGGEEEAKFPNQLYQFLRVWFCGDLAADFEPTVVIEHKDLPVYRAMMQGESKCICSVLDTAASCPITQPDFPVVPRQ
jgi:hypothetical protein